MKTALLRAVSHDLRTPLTAILSRRPRSIRSVRSRAGGEVRDVVLQSATRLAALVEKLLDLSRLESGAANQLVGAYSLER